MYTYIDVESCGFHGPSVLIQWADDDGEIHLHEVFRTPVSSTLALIERLCTRTIVGFNLAFDWFHICQTYTTLKLLSDPDSWPDTEEYALREPEGRFGPCVKPAGCLDLMLHARKGPYQSLMDRDDIRIKRVPTVLAWQLAEELGRRIPFKDVYFARKKDPSQRWQVEDVVDELGDLVPEFKNLVLRFAPSSALKALAQDVLELEHRVIKYEDVELPRSAYPTEYGYAPWALAVGKPGAWNGAWPDYGKIRNHIEHWAFNAPARQYAEDDITYTRGLHTFFGKPEPNDDDSVLACMVGAVRWRGYSVDVEKLKTLRDRCQKVREQSKYNFNSTAVCKKYLGQVMSQMEQLALREGTKGPVLDRLAEWQESVVCESCNGLGCEKCDDGLIKTGKAHPVAERAKEIIAYRSAGKEMELYDKLIFAGRFHASFKVIGTKSSRMSGDNELNAQGIKALKEIRESFGLADPGWVLQGGDFESFEVCIMEADWADPKLREMLLSGKKLHGIFAMMLYPGKSYDEIVASKGKNPDMYHKGKQGVFAMSYGGTEYTLQTRGGHSKEVAEQAFISFGKEFPGVAAARKKITDQFCSMRQPGGLGSKIEWHDPSDYVESMLGFRRYFTLENSVCKTLFELAESPPKEWTQIKIKVVRRDREQTACGALRSALFGCAFAIQAGNSRAAGNHRIQSTGAQITKNVERSIWDIQPPGIEEFRVIPMNIHDEILSPTLPPYTDQVTQIVHERVEHFRPLIPLIGIDWRTGLKNWGEKG